MQSENQHCMQKWTGMIACNSNAKGEVACFGLLLCSFCEMEDKKQDHWINNQSRDENKVVYDLVVQKKSPDLQA